MTSEVVYISANIDAIDISLITKDITVNSLIEKFNLNLANIGCIGDGKNDIPFLTIDNLGLVGAPRNAQQEVKEILTTKKHYISNYEYFDGFYDFYSESKKLSLSHIFTDRDGVLLHETLIERKQEIQNLFENIGNNCPNITILTGSSREQNLWFIEKFKIRSALDKNNAIKAPYYIYGENGAIKVDCFSLKSYINDDIISTSSIQEINNQVFKPCLEEICVKLFPKYGLSFSKNEDDQINKLYIPQKETMFTINLPNKLGKNNDNRYSPLTNMLRNDILEILENQIRKNNIKYKLL